MQDGDDKKSTVGPGKDLMIKDLMIKDALHISLTPEVERFNRDGGLELPACWAATLKSATRPSPGISKYM